MKLRQQSIYVVDGENRTQQSKKELLWGRMFPVVPITKRW